jgi:hypothetical protein
MARKYQKNHNPPKFTKNARPNQWKTWVLWARNHFQHAQYDECETCAAPQTSRQAFNDLT